MDHCILEITMIQKYLQSIDKISSEDEILCFAVRNNVVLCVNHISLISAKKKRMVAILSCWCKSFYQQFRRGEHASVSLESTPLWFAKGLFKILCHGSMDFVQQRCTSVWRLLFNSIILFSTKKKEKKKFAALLDYVCQKKRGNITLLYDSFWYHFLSTSW